MRRLIVTLLLLLWTGTLRPTHAREIVQGDSCLIPPEQTISGNLYAVCRELRIAGRVEGSVIGAATSATLSGTVTGDVFMASGQLDITGTVGEDVYFAGVVLRVLPAAAFASASADLVSVTLSSTLTRGSHLPGNITALGYQLLLLGRVDGEVNFWGSALELHGSIGGTADATVGDATSEGLARFPTFIIPFQFDLEFLRPGLRLGENATIAGRLRYRASVEAELPAGLADTTEFERIDTRTGAPAPQSVDTAYSLSAYLSQVVREFATLGVLGLVGLLLLPRAFQTPLRALQARPLTCLGIGSFTLIVVIPAGLAIFVLSIFIVFVLSLLRLDDLMIAIGALLGILNIGALSIFAFVGGFIARVVVCLGIGRALLHVARRYDGSARALLASLLLGVALMAFVIALPVVGLITYGMTAALGLGAILSVLQTQWRSPHPAQSLPPPPLQPEPLGLGMDNLPPGFVMWDD
ncbi:MAG: polymer-forming cytoskeletal protein [Chloroflexi bacterium]|nr:polymer-forming cytoskeletal protein [Chloroflexota bacterium]